MTPEERKAEKQRLRMASILTAKALERMDPDRRSRAEPFRVRLKRRVKGETGPTMVQVLAWEDLVEEGSPLIEELTLDAYQALGESLFA